MRRLYTGVAVQSISAAVTRELFLGVGLLRQRSHGERVRAEGGGGQAFFVEEVDDREIGPASSTA